MSTVSEAPTIIETSNASRDASGRVRTYEVRTFGCQMNVHDSERLSGSLEAAGYVRAEGVEADVVVINTCAVRENADNKLYGNLGRHPRQGALGRRGVRHPQHGRAAEPARACAAQ
jgi:tRNA-2-methylthio-N6-dimethylallyladenosine synthase